LASLTATEFDALFRPRGIAVVGASENALQAGYQPLHSLMSFGYGGKIHPVNPNRKTVLGLPAYASVADVPQPCDLAIIATPAGSMVEVIEQCARAGIRAAVAFSTVVHDNEADANRFQSRLMDTARRHGVRLVGPNCQGALNLHDKVYAGFGSLFRMGDLPAGVCAMVTQSGGFGTGAVKLAQAAGVHFGYVVSTGNEWDIDTLDLIETFLLRDDVALVATYIEGVKDGRRLLALGEKALELGKPILVWKVGNSSSGARAAQSHTANLTAGADLYRAVFRHGGFVELRDMDDFIDIARALTSGRMATGRNVGVVSTTGGAAVLIADRCEESGFLLPQLAAQTREALKGVVPPTGSVENPVDATAQQDGMRLNQALKILLDDPRIDQAMVARSTASGALGKQWAEGIVAVAAGSRKPVYAYVTPDGAEDAIAILNGGKVSWFTTPSRMVAAAEAARRFAVKRARYERRSIAPSGHTLLPRPAREGAMTESEAKTLLGAYGIEVTKERVFSETALSGVTAIDLAFPVVVKLVSRDIPHKTEVGGVALNVASVEAVRERGAAIIASARRLRPDAAIEGVVVQEMARGIEVIAGVVNDPYFGPVVAVGLGGIFTEVLHDVTHRCAPFDTETAAEMIGELRGRAMLDGVRGAPPADVEELKNALVLLSRFANDHRDWISEIDVNPLIVREQGRGVVAADALIVVSGAPPQRPGSA